MPQCLTFVWATRRGMCSLTSSPTLAVLVLSLTLARGDR